MAGKISVVGIGPGSYDMMTIRAARTLEESDCIVGYHVYVDLVKDHFPGKEFLTTPMRKEEDRTRMAFEEALKGKNVAFICSGDSGIYGMAGLVYEVAGDYAPVEIEVLPGITAASSGAAILGAPLIHDFAIISLSDLLTPWEKIEARLRAAAASDLGIVLYNPSSHKRPDYLQKACDILLEILPETRVCGTAGNIGREREATQVYTLRELRDTKVDMFTTVFIGNADTEVIDGKMVTPRGYRVERNK